MPSILDIASIDAETEAHEAATKAEYFTRLFEQHKVDLLRYANQLVRWPLEADDILQESAAIAWRTFDRFELGSNFNAWVKKIIYYCVLTSVKKLGPPTRSLTDELLAGLAVGEKPLDYWEEALHVAFLEIPKEAAKLLWEYHVENRSGDEMAESLGCTRGAFHQRAHVARRKLAESIEALHDAMRSSSFHETRGSTILSLREVGFSRSLTS